MTLLASCAGPPPEAFVGGIPSTGAGIALGTDTANEACTQQPATPGADIFCGTWEQPSGHVTPLPDTADLASIAGQSPWRSALDQRFLCGPPAPTTVLGSPALLLDCTRRAGGWPQAALVTRIGGQTFAGDSILPAVPVLERSIAVLSGRAGPTEVAALPPGRAAALLASRLAAQSFGAGDIGRYQQLLTAGTRANLAEDFPAAERAFRAAYALHRKALGPTDPATAIPLMLVALQLSDQGRTAEADTAFDAASRLLATKREPAGAVRLAHYRGLHAINRRDPAAALPLLHEAERLYASTLPPELLAARPARATSAAAVGRRGSNARFDDAPLLTPEQEAALIGVVETRRYQAIALRALGQTDAAQAQIASAEDLATARGLEQRDLTARLARTGALASDAATEGSGDGQMRRASAAFTDAQPGTRPVAQTLLLHAAQLARRGDTTEVLGLCRRAVALLRELRAGTSAELMTPCLATYATAAARDPSQEQPLLAEMFAAGQLMQGGITARQIALASARLAENSKNPAVGDAIRRQQDAALAVAELQRQSDAAAADPKRADPEALARSLAAAQTRLAEADATLQAASPNYGQLVQEVAGADQVLAALAPGEAFVSFALDADRGWVFALRDGRVRVAAMPGGTAGLAVLVSRIRTTVEPGASGPPPFDLQAAQALFDATLRPIGPTLDGAEALTVVPTGPLLSTPFELMLTGPASADAMATAPWLVRRHAITHVPAAANFVTLRRAGTALAARRPWYGFGDFRPVTFQQASRTYPSAGCRDSARLFAGLPPLPFAQRELAAARQLMGAQPADQLLGPNFNAPTVLRQDWRDYRVLHFATHALLPTDLTCQAEPALVTSSPPGAADAAGALLTASEVTTLQLDADVVILSACNSGGPAGATSGESLSGLARAFFYAGARSLLVTHWSINDQASALLIASTLQRLRAGDPHGLAGAFQSAQLSLLNDAGRALPAAIAHPFYWAPFALVGEGRGRTLPSSPLLGPRASRPPLTSS